MPSTIIQTPLWLKAEEELRNQLLSHDEIDFNEFEDNTVSLTDTTLGRHEAEFSSKGIKAAARLGAARHVLTFALVAAMGSLVLFSM